MLLLKMLPFFLFLSIRQNLGKSTTFLFLLKGSVQLYNCIDTYDYSSTYVSHWGYLPCPPSISSSFNCFASSDTSVVIVYQLETNRDPWERGKWWRSFCCCLQSRLCFFIQHASSCLCGILGVVWGEWDLLPLSSVPASLRPAFLLSWAPINW